MDLSQFTPEQIAALKAALLTDASGRSPIKPPQLHDLRLLPTKDDPRPTFFWSADPPRTGEDLNRTTAYPRLMWHGTSGEEVTVTDAAAQSSYTQQGYLLVPLGAQPAADPLDLLRAHLESFSPEDRALLLAGQQQDRLASLRAQLAALPAAELEVVVGGLDAEPAEPARRGPGRPRKESAA
jgi:hypothetical protein